MEEENKYSGEILNFHDLLQEYNIEIPIIQRDYAQGREDKSEIRENFLDALLDCVENNNPIKLDFIYGSLVGQEFQPLDGQQRLTTLFLLHWYAATKDEIITREKITGLLQRFTYETRITSREFCTALVEESVTIDNKDQKVSGLIINSSWFFLSWENDPTIDAMLRTIDDIHERFYEIGDLWNKLTSPLIQFYFVELENMGLTDDLYIKMNARGKLLTSFENFKAGFQKRIEDKNWEKETNLKESFGVKIDTDWTDYFWENFRKNNSIDDALIRFIAAIAMIMQSVERKGGSDQRIELINQLQEDTSSVRPTHFSESGFKYLINYFNIYQEQLVLRDYNKLGLPFPMWRHKSKDTILSMIVYDDNAFSRVQKNSATYTQKVLFFAQAEYFRRNEDFDKEMYEDWMRVVRNIVSRADIDKNGNRPDIIRSPQAFDGGINLVKELSEGSNNIYKFLSESKGLKSQFAKEQIAEEVAKAKLIVHNKELKNILFQAEDNDLLRGKISFLFYVIGYDYSVRNFDADFFQRVSNVFKNYFDNDDCLTNNIRRAIMTIEVNGQYEFYTYWWSYWHVGNATKRRLFDKFRELEYFINNNDYREYFKKLIIKLLSKTPEQIIEGFQPGNGFPNWKKRLIKEAGILDSWAETNYIAIAEDNSYCYLLKSKRPRDLEGNKKIE